MSAPEDHLEISYGNRKHIFEIERKTTYDELEAMVLAHFGITPAAGELYDVVVVDVEDGEGNFNNLK
jgi:hypothetical protein